VVFRGPAALVALPDQEPSPLVLVQLELLDGHSLSSLAIRRFNRADMFAATAHDDDAPASQLGAADRKNESVA